MRRSLFSIDYVTALCHIGNNMMAISVGMKELKGKLRGSLNKVRHGEELVVTYRGKEIARMIPISRERSAVKQLMESGRAAWTGGKPLGMKGIKAKGGPIAKTVLEDRR